MKKHTSSLRWSLSSGASGRGWRPLGPWYRKCSRMTRKLSFCSLLSVIFLFLCLLKTDDYNVYIYIYVHTYIYIYIYTHVTYLIARDAKWYLYFLPPNGMRQSSNWIAPFLPPPGFCWCRRRKRCVATAPATQSRQNLGQTCQPFIMGTYGIYPIYIYNPIVYGIYYIYTYIYICRNTQNYIWYNPFPLVTHSNTINTTQKPPFRRALRHVRAYLGPLKNTGDGIFCSHRSRRFSRLSGHDLVVLSPISSCFIATLWWTNILLWKITILLMGKSTISMAIFHCFLYVHQRLAVNLESQKIDPIHDADRADHQGNLGTWSWACPTRWIRVMSMWAKVLKTSKHGSSHRLLYPLVN